MAPAPSPRGSLVSRAESCFAGERVAARDSARRAGEGRAGFLSRRRDAAGRDAATLEGQTSFPIGTLAAALGVGSARRILPRALLRSLFRGFFCAFFWAPLWIALASLLACSSPCPETGGSLEVVFREVGEGSWTVEVLGLPRDRLEGLRTADLELEEWHRVLTVHSGAVDPPADLPPMLGRYEALPDRLRFTPRFPLEPGLDYLAHYRAGPQDGPPDGPPELLARYHVPMPHRSPSTRVLAVHPSGDPVPENLLRIYLSFSAPMSTGEASQRIRLEELGGAPIPYPFVAEGTELWNPARDRLTLFLDPGRIKRRVGPNLEVGAPLAAGRAYRLVVEQGWRDGQGNPLVSGFEKVLRVGPPDRRPPDPRAWQVESPTSAAGHLEIALDEPVDRALGLRLIRVLGPAGEEIEGEVTLEAGELRWRFLPAGPWSPGRYRIRADPALEDPSGNSLRAPFETALGEAPGAGRRGEPVFLSFDIGEFPEGP